MNITGLLRRIAKLEQRLVPVPPEPFQSVVPEWLAAEWKAQGIVVAPDGRPPLRSLAAELSR